MSAWGEEPEETENAIKYSEEIQVHEPSDLDRELERLSGFLADLNPPWVVRMSALRRFQNLCLTPSPAIARFPNFVSSVARHLKAGLAAQLADRRSKVVKETTESLSTLTIALKDVPLSEADHEEFVSVATHWIEQLFQTLPQTVKVISEAGKQGMHDVLENIRDDKAHTLLRKLMEGTAHKNGPVRANCLECMPLLLAHFAKADGPEAKVDSDVLVSLEETIDRGLADALAPARTAARLCVLEFARIAPKQLEGLLARQPAAARKAIEKELGASKPGAAVSAAPAKAAARVRPSIRDRLGASKAAAESKATEGPPAASSPSDSAPSPAAPTPSEPAAAAASTPSSAPKKQVRILASSERKYGSLASPLKTGAGGTLTAKRSLNKKESADLTNTILLSRSKLSSEELHAIASGARPASASVATAGAPDVVTAHVDVQEPADPSRRHSVDPASLAKLPAHHASKVALFLLSKLLDLETPQMTDRMLGYLMEDGVFELFLSFITHFAPDALLSLIAAELAKDSPSVSVDPAAALAAAEKAIERSRTLAQSQAQSADDAVMKRSFRAMNLLCDNSQPTTRLLHHFLRPAVLQLLSAFHPRSTANFYHICKVLSAFIKWFPSEIQDIVASPEGAALFRTAFDYLHEPPVGEVILDLLCAPTETKEGKTRLLELLLSQWMILDVMCVRITDPRAGETVGSCNALFLQQLLDRMVVNSSASFLVSSLASNRLVNALVDAICNETDQHPSWQRLQCATLLSSLLKRSSSATVDEPGGPMNFLHAPPSRVANKLCDLFPVLAEKLIPLVPRLCAALVLSKKQFSGPSAESTEAAASFDEVKVGPEAAATPSSDQRIQFSAYTVEHSFTQFRLATLDCLCELTHFQSAAPLLQNLTAELWDTLTAWFFQYKHNSMFLGRFLTLFVAALHQKTELAALRRVLVDLGFIDQIAAFYSAPENRPCTLHSFILLVGNHIRLTADQTALQDPSAFLPTLLSASTSWQSFLPLLKEHTLKQVASWQTPNQGRKAAEPQAGPPGLARAPSSTTVNVPRAPGLEQTPPDSEAVAQAEREGIDLGSTYARSLGYQI